MRSLTGLRAVLAWWVVGFHFVSHSLPAGFAKAVLDGGYVAVDVFFVLSGYVLMRRYSQTVFTSEATGSFYRRRFARIYPLYVVSLAIGVAADWRSFSRDVATVALQVRVGLELLLLNAWHHRAMFQYNFGAWSLSVEAFFYLLCPWLLPRIAKARVRGLLMLVVLGWLAMFIAPAVYTALDPDHLGRAVQRGDEVMGAWYLTYFPVQRLPEFVAGAVLARLAWRPRWAAPLGAIALVTMVAAKVVPYAFLRTGFPLPAIALLVLGVAAWDRGVLASRPLVALGHASFATYILHWPLMMLWARFDRSIWNEPRSLFSFLPFLCVVSLAAYHLVEEPLRRAITRPKTRLAPG